MEQSIIDMTTLGDKPHDHDDTTISITAHTPATPSAPLPKKRG